MSIMRNLFGMTLNCPIQNDSVNYLEGSWLHFGEVGNLTTVELPFPIENGLFVDM